MKKKKLNIKKAIKKPGSLTATAKRQGGYDNKNKRIKKSWLKEKAKGKGKTAQRARFALTLGKLRKKKR